MLGRLVLDEHRARTDHPELGRHLGDAVADLRTVIGRLESEFGITVVSDPRSCGGKVSPGVTRPEQPDTQSLGTRAPRVRQMEQRA